MDKYSKIAEGLTSLYTTKAKERQKAKAELQFNQSNGAYESALKSKDAKEIEKVVNALIKKREDLYNKIFQTGGNDEDIKEYRSVTEQLQRLEIHVNDLHSEGVI